MTTVFLILALIFGISGGLALLQVSNVPLDFLTITQLHRLPLLNTIPVPWAYVSIGIIFALLAFLFYTPPGGYAWQKKEIK